MAELPAPTPPLNKEFPLLHYGVLIGAAVLLLVTLTAILLAKKASSGTANYREEDHESFLGRKRD